MNMDENREIKRNEKNFCILFLIFFVASAKKRARRVKEKRIVQRG
jgi:hypothetical protein